MNLLGSLGIDIPLLFAQVINFAVLLFILKWLVYRPLLDRIDTDEAILLSAQKKEKQLESDKQKFKDQKKQELIELNQHVTSVIDEAEGIAREIKKTAVAEADNEKQAVIKQIKDRLREINYVETIKA